MATLSTVTRHSCGDLTLYLFKFSSIATTDSYAVTNMPGVLGVWISPWAGVTTLNNMEVSYTNSTTGMSLEFIGLTATTTASVFALGLG